MTVKVLDGEGPDLWEQIASIQERNDARRRGWTDERVKTLKELWAAGYTGDQIAVELGGLTRNAVIGKIHRLGFSGRVLAKREPKPSIPRRVRVNPTTIRKARAEALAELFVSAPEVPAPATTELSDKSCSIFDLTDDTCRWPFGDPKDANFYFCGQQSAGVLPYCGAHARMAYQPAEPRSTKRAA